MGLKNKEIEVINAGSVPIAYLSIALGLFERNQWHHLNNKGFQKTVFHLEIHFNLILRVVAVNT